MDEQNTRTDAVGVPGAEAVDTTTSFKLVELIDVAVPLPAQHAEVHLSELDAPYRSLSFPIGLAEGVALSLAQSRTDSARPMTHELFSEVLRRVNVDVIALRLISRVRGVLHAELDLMTTRGRQVVPCRPSDGLVLCLRQTVVAPVLVAEDLFDDD